MSNYCVGQQTGNDYGFAGEGEDCFSFFEYESSPSFVTSIHDAHPLKLSITIDWIFIYQSEETIIYTMSNPL